MKKTKILCTIGPSSISKNVQKKMYEAGINGVRINTAFGSLGEYESTVKNVRRIGEISILVDIKGPELRIKVPESRPVKKGETVYLGSESELSFNHDIYDQLETGDKILIDDGMLQTEAVGKKDKQVQLLVKNDWVLKDGRGVNIPGKTLNTPCLNEKDLRIIEFAKENEVEYIALSFTRNRADVLTLRERLADSDVGIVAKIENLQGFENFHEILSEADGIMIARGDLGVELPLEQLPLIQKQMIGQCNQQGKTVITATEMLESMIENPRPTRAEISDVANAVLTEQMY